MIQSKILIYVIVGLLSLVAVSNTFKNLNDTFFPEEKTYSLEAVELMIKHDRLKKEIQNIRLENEVIEKDNERLKKSIGADSSYIFDSSRQYRDSLRSAIFNR